MTVHWTVRARRRVRRSIARRLCEEFRSRPEGTNPCTKPLEALMDGLANILDETFPGNQAIVVFDQLRGYRRKDKLFTLLVEVFGEPNPGGRRPGAYVVRIGPPDIVEKELRGWDCCKPEGLTSDLVFLPLDRGYADADRQQMSLVYGDAQQFLGVERILSFEEAALSAVLFGTPAFTSIGIVLWELYERIAHLLYSQWFEECLGTARAGKGAGSEASGSEADASIRSDVPSGQPANSKSEDAGEEAPRTTLDVRNLLDSMAQWKLEPARSVRVKVNLIARRGPQEFLDPIDYLEYVNQFIPFSNGVGGVQGGTEPFAPPDAKSDADPLRPSLPIDLVPCMLRGCSHGDLHGRNILVGVVRGKALWPTVFDYEDMGPCNLIGWDFVKLETELKIRAYPLIFGAPQARLIAKIQELELELATATEARNRGDQR